MSANRNAAPDGHREAAQGMHADRMTLADIIDQFRHAMQASGINPPEEIVADGILHRFSTNAKRSSDDAGWYVLYSDIPVGVFGDCRMGITKEWRANRLTSEEESEVRRRIEIARSEAETLLRERAERAAKLAAAIWKAAKPVSEHRYLMRKHIEPTATLRVTHFAEIHRTFGFIPKARGDVLQGSILVAPIKGRRHNPENLQLIDEDGRKTTLPWGVTEGGYWATGPLPSSGRVVVCSGVASALSIARALGEPVAAALSPWNLKAAAETILAEHPGVQIVIAADLIAANIGDVGRPHPEAVKAAQSLRCPLAVPYYQFGNGADFNDLYNWDGIKAVRACIEIAVPPERPVHEEQVTSARPLNRPLTINEALEAKISDPDFVIGPLQPGDIGILSGADGAGKSLVALMMAASVAFGISAGGVVDKPRAAGRVLMICGEDRRDDHIRRLKALGEYLRQEHRIDSDDDGMLTLLPLEGHRMPLYAPQPNGYAVTSEGIKFADMIKTGGYRLVILDPLRMFHDCVESDGPGMDGFARWLVTVAMAAHCAIIVVHHASQDAILNGRVDHHAGRGATDFPAACRAGWVLRGMTEKEAAEAGIDDDYRRDWRFLYNGKANHGREDGGRWLQRRGGLWIRSSYTPSELAETKGKTRGVVKKGDDDKDW